MAKTGFQLSEVTHFGDVFSLCWSGGLFLLTLLSSNILSSNILSAVDSVVVDEINVTISVSCTLSGTGMNTHTAEIGNDQYESDIGTTTLKAFCNDNEGFSIYAAGYTGNKIGETNSNKLVGTSASGNATIDTGLATSGNVSNWSMKLTASSDSGDTTGTNALTIDSAPNTSDGANASFSQYHTVPNEYVKVAHKNSSTSMDESTGGATLTSTYAAYISRTQPADTYTGQVIYTLVHPANADTPVHPDQIGVIYHANGSSFAGGVTENRMVYNTRPMYIATTPQILKSSNIDDNGLQNGAYTDEEDNMETFAFPGASKVKVVLTYGITNNEAEILMSEGEWTWDDGNPSINLYSVTVDLAGEDEVYLFDGDSVTIQMDSWGVPVSGYDYGVYARVFPIYPTEQTGTELSTEFSTISIEDGVYAQTVDWYGSWYADINNTHYDFLNEEELVSFLENNATALRGTTIDLYRGLTYTEAFTRANKVQDDGYYKQQELTKSMCDTVAIAQNQILKDVRDGNTYMVGKLKDGNCWMLNNLTLDLTDSTTATNMNATNTNATDEAIYNLLNGGSTNAGWSNIAVVNVGSGFSNNGYSVPRINNVSKDELVTSFGPASTNGKDKVGIYYNYCAASASTYCYVEGAGVDIPNTLVDTSQDICPANWRMPTGSINGEFNKLNYQYRFSQNALDSGSLWYDLSVTLSGFYSGRVNLKNVDGNFWSSTNYNGSFMYYLDAYDDIIYSIISNDRGSGQSIRCLVGE